MALLYVKVLDTATGKPITDAAVVITLNPLGTAVTSGFTGVNGEYVATVPTVKTAPAAYTITVSCNNYGSTTGTRTFIGNQTLYYTTQLAATPISLPNPITYPTVVSVGNAPDLLVYPAQAGVFDEIVVKVEGAFPSTSRSPIPASGPVVIPMAHRLLVAPPVTLTLISHTERIRQANEIRQVYTITVSGRTAGRLVQLGTVVTTALLVDVGDLPAQLTASPWLTPWPGVVPVERGGYAEIVFALPRESEAISYSLFLTAHDNGIDGPVSFQAISTFAIAPGAASYQPYRVRIPDYQSPYTRLLLSSVLGNRPPLWVAYRSF